MSKSDIKQKKCIHHWIIDTPQGRTSRGKCKRCGAIAEFSNAWISDFEKEKAIITEP